MSSAIQTWGYIRHNTVIYAYSAFVFAKAASQRKRQVCGPTCSCSSCDICSLPLGDISRALVLCVSPGLASSWMEPQKVQPPADVVPSERDCIRQAALSHFSSQCFPDALVVAVVAKHSLDIKCASCSSPWEVNCWNLNIFAERCCSGLQA